MKFDLHVHSDHSKDSKSSHDEILEVGLKRGLDGFAICDHDTVGGGLACEKRALELGLNITVIPGVEVTSSKGQHSGLGIRKNRVFIESERNNSEGQETWTHQYHTSPFQTEFSWDRKFCRT